MSNSSIAGALQRREVDLCWPGIRQASDLTHKMRQSFSDGLFVAQAVAGSDG